jgi:hypothetical protein
LQRRRSRAKSTNSASTPSTPEVVDSGVTPRRLQSLLPPFSRQSPGCSHFPRR